MHSVLAFDLVVLIRHDVECRHVGIIYSIITMLYVFILVLQNKFNFGTFVL